MPTFKIELPETFSFERAGHVMTVRSADLSESIIAQLVMHGATQKIGDAAAGKKDAEAKTAMDNVLTALVEGNWGRVRSGGAGEPEHMRFVRDIIRKLLGDANKKKYAEMKGDADARREFLTELFEAQSDEARAKIEEAAKAELELERKRKAETAKKTAGLGISL